MKMANYSPAGISSCLRAGITFLCCACLPFVPVFAQTVEARLPSGITAKASFHEGLPALPAVLVLHGFLQADHSTPMSSLAGNLSSKGYTVLNPTITLGINRRSQSMACEAVHTHTMEDEVAEVGYWVNWLHKRGHREIVLTGFSSTGNHAILQFNAQGGHPAVKKAILANLNPVSIDERELQKARQNPGNRTLARFTMGYCKSNYMSTTRSYLSYALFNESRLLEMLKNTPVQTEVILGSADTVLPANWADRIGSLHAPVRVRIIGNANHFFDGAQEFDLADEVESILKSISPK